MCILPVYTLLKVVSYCDFSVLSMSVMDFQKREVWVGGVSSIQVCLGFLEFFLTLQSLLQVDDGPAAATFHKHNHINWALCEAI